MGVILTVEDTQGKHIRKETINDLEKSIYSEARRIVDEMYGIGFDYYYRHHRVFFPKITFLL